jgi:hypothetical protein
VQGGGWCGRHCSGASVFFIWCVAIDRGAEARRPRVCVWLSSWNFQDFLPDRGSEHDLWTSTM